jgi:(methylthio)acryloyl-CoA hydratase
MTSPKERTMTQEQVLTITETGAICHLQLNRPDKRNALNDDLIAALDAFFAAVPAGTRAIVISGNGGHFSSGLDLSQHVARQPLEVMAHSRNWHRVMAMIANSTIPVIAAMSGAVMGGGLEPAMCGLPRSRCVSRCPRVCAASLSAAVVRCAFRASSGRTA